MPSFLEEYQAMQARHKRERDALIAKHLGGSSQTTYSQGPFSSLADMMSALGSMPKTPPKPKLSPAERIKEIEHELDIIRGRVPTPAGYSIEPAKAKALIKELAELKNKV